MGEVTLIELGGNAPGWMVLTAANFKAGPISMSGEVASYEKIGRPKKPISPEARRESMARARSMLSVKRLFWPEGYYSLADAVKKWGWSYNALSAALARDSLKAKKAGHWWIVNDEIMLAYKKRCDDAKHGRGRKV